MIVVVQRRWRIFRAVLLRVVGGNFDPLCVSRVYACTRPTRCILRGMATNGSSTDSKFVRPKPSRPRSNGFPTPVPRHFLGSSSLVHISSSDESEESEESSLDYSYQSDTHDVT